MVIKYDRDGASSRVPSQNKIFLGRLVHSKSLKELEILPNAAVGVERDGRIAFIHRFESKDELQREFARRDPSRVSMIHLKPSQFLFPGMVDTHLHAPQWPNLALGMEGTLREWVENWTDPIEVS